MPSQNRTSQAHNMHDFQTIYLWLYRVPHDNFQWRNHHHHYFIGPLCRPEEKPKTPDKRVIPAARLAHWPNHFWGQLFCYQYLCWSDHDPIDNPGHQLHAWYSSIIHSASTNHVQYICHVFLSFFLSAARSNTEGRISCSVLCVKHTMPELCLNECT